MGRKQLSLLFPPLFAFPEIWTNPENTHVRKFAVRKNVRPGVDFVDGGTLGHGLMPLLQDYDRVVVLDIVTAQGEPGTVYLLENEDMRKALSFHDSTHDTDFVDLLQTCDLMGCRPECFVIGLEPFDFRSMDAELTDEAKKVLPAFCRKAVLEILRRGWANAKVKDDLAQSPYRAE